MHLHTFRIGKGIPQFEERNVRVLPHQLFEEGPMWGQLACIARAALRRRRRMTSGLDLMRPASSCCRRELQTQRSRAPA